MKRGYWPRPGMQLAATVAAAALSVSALAQAGGVRLSNAWSRALPPTSTNGAVYLQLHNEGNATRLVGGDTPAAKHLEVHTHEMVDGLARMRKLDGLDIGAGQAAAFEPGAHHLMLMNLTAPLAEGAQFPITLEFANGSRVTTQVTVMPLDHQPSDAGHGQHGHGMPAHGSEKKRN